MRECQRRASQSMSSLTFISIVTVTKVGEPGDEVLSSRRKERKVHLLSGKKYTSSKIFDLDARNSWHRYTGSIKGNCYIRTSRR